LRQLLLAGSRKSVAAASLAGSNKEAGSQKMHERFGPAEHLFGTLKHRAGWSNFLVRSFEKAGGE